MKVFVDTGANINTIHRSFLKVLRDSGIRLKQVNGPKTGIKIQFKLPNMSHTVSGDQVVLQVEVATSMGKVKSVQEFLTLDEDAEDMVMGVNWPWLVEFERVSLVSWTTIRSGFLSQIPSVRTEMRLLKINYFRNSRWKCFRSMGKRVGNSAISILSSPSWTVTGYRQNAWGDLVQAIRYERFESRSSY
jgi:hypothetical protein